MSWLEMQRIHQDTMRYRNKKRLKWWTYPIILKVTELRVLTQMKRWHWDNKVMWLMIWKENPIRIDSSWNKSIMIWFYKSMRICLKVLRNNRLWESNKLSSFKVSKKKKAWVSNLKNKLTKPWKFKIMKMKSCNRI